MDSAELKAAFSRFEHASDQLSAFYSGLEDRVESLSAALVAARAETREQLDEARRLNDRLKRLLDLLPAGVVVLAADGSIDEFNPVAESLLGPLTTGEPWRNVVSRAFAPRPDDGHDITLTSGHRVHLETSALTAVEGQAAGQILVLTDVTRTRGLQDQLALHRRLSAKTEMAAALAHQVRTPLATAMLYAGQLKGLHGREGPDFAARLLESLRALEHLVDDMLLFARGGALETEVVALDTLLDALADAAGAFEAQTGFATLVEGGDLPARVRVNVPTLVNVSMNLVKNGCQIAGSHRDGAPDFVIGAEIGPWATLSFTDRGPGIPAEFRDQIFEPFFSRARKGTGLGLPVARSVVRSLGGELVLDDGYADGARFLMHLPLVPEGEHTSDHECT